MNSVKNLFTIFFILTAHLLFAKIPGKNIELQQQKKKFTISGYVHDGKTGESMISASIYLKGKTQGAISNNYGFYSLTVEEGQHTVLVSLIGYATVEIELDIRTNIRKDFTLSVLPILLQQISVRTNANKTENTEISTASVTPDQIKSIPALLGEPDIQSAILSLPGVNSVGEGTTGFNVRGGKPITI